MGAAWTSEGPHIDKQKNGFDVTLHTGDKTEGNAVRRSFQGGTQTCRSPRLSVAGSAP